MAIAALLLAAAATLSIPIAFRFLIDQGFSLPNADPLTQSVDMSQVNSVFIMLFLLAVLLAAATALRFYLVSWLGDRITADIRTAVFSNVMRQDLKLSLIHI